jgi:hypothetical protein
VRNPKPDLAKPALKKRMLVIETEEEEQPRSSEVVVERIQKGLESSYVEKKPIETPSFSTRQKVDLSDGKGIFF